jgi:hypothetical protein
MSLLQKDLPPDQNMFLPHPAVLKGGAREDKETGGVSGLLLPGANYKHELNWGWFGGSF